MDAWMRLTDAADLIGIVLVAVLLLSVALGALVGCAWVYSNNHHLSRKPFGISVRLVTFLMTILTLGDK